MATIGILPAAGQASRLRGLPKFLLPLPGVDGTLLEHHLRLMSHHVDRVLIPTRPEWKKVLEGFELPKNVLVSSMETDTLSQTIREALEREHFVHCLLGLPDTVFLEGNPYDALAAHSKSDDLVLACFDTQDSQRGNLGSVKLSAEGKVLDHADKDLARDWGKHWGAMRFSQKIIGELPSQSPTVGVLISSCLAAKIPVAGFVHSSEYFDCGTVSEYARALVSLEQKTR